MLTVETLPAEGPRYAAPMVCVPALWAGPPAWRAVGGLLAHRGWECHLLDLRRIRAGIAGRAAAVADYVATLAAAPVVVGHDAGALVALAAAARTTIAAVVLLAPFPTTRGAARILSLGPRALVALVLGGRVAPAGGPAWLDVAEPAATAIRALLGPEEAAGVRDALRGRVPGGGIGRARALVVAGDGDRLLPAAAAASLARALGAELQTVQGAGHWLLGGAAWQTTVRVVHRWLVQTLGETLLERYAETMSERDADDGAED
jgi:pimeloyl-ACP methyl ester carboxylesterase